MSTLTRSKLIIASLITLTIGVIAADKTGVFTRSTTLTETKHVFLVQASYDTAGNLTQFVVHYDSDRSDTSGFVGTTRGADTWTLDKINALADMVDGQTNKFKSQLLSRWGNFDNLAENYVTGWKNPSWMSPQ